VEVPRIFANHRTLSTSGWWSQAAAVVVTTAVPDPVEEVDIRLGSRALLDLVRQAAMLADIQERVRREDQLLRPTAEVRTMGISVPVVPFVVVMVPEAVPAGTVAVARMELGLAVVLHTRFRRPLLRPMPFDQVMGTRF
jgi:hypothetical protein